MKGTESVTPEGIRRIIIEQSKRANVGHIGSALSIADMIAVLYGGVLNIPDPEDPDRDRFVLSKGHAALALYAALYLRGLIPEGQLSSYCGDGTLCGVHPEHELEGVDFSTGSLGQGLAIGAGTALAARLQGRDFKSYVLVSDAECNEGSLWETIMFAAHHRLSNLIAIVDDNAQQAFGKTKDVIDLEPLRDKWEAFGWHAVDVDGHDTDALRTALTSLDSSDSRPTVIVAKTVSGRGVSFMEGKVEWHYLPLSDEQYERALNEIGGSDNS